MADIRYFSDYNDSSVECTWVIAIPNDEFELLFPGVRGFRYDGYHKWVGNAAGYGSPLSPITRKIEYKAAPSKHKCNAKCLGGKINGVCECSCNGKNHGTAGLFSKLIVNSATRVN